ncbi:hypothetical protein WL30_02705 [Burkholderia ubonensis]|uniref:hypothetical protein n=1 Tax=Burkholderia ubonensis TaxID=101571 RepID=UPI00075B655D|nr:hypothetical protein [Burkholderia ubonensis]KWA78311.1 hypothetical protein WL30_02705 [Burkholderia ubonensis]KWB12658.1 hypothetical protein WL31_19440 [Burkholderia ubonensis]KWB64046.1 hypothetical protein WL37_20495 [Burkholderia ubonensis]KWN68292.1 hypothetical protein WM24_09460 [Burkholderia ubonensis]
MERSTKELLVRDIARDVLMQVAPQEAPIFTAASKAYFSNPSAALKAPRTDDAALGFGADPFSILFTPLVLQVVTEVMSMLGGMAQKAAEAAIGNEVSDLVRQVFKRFRPSAEDNPLTLTSEQLGSIHEYVLAASARLRLPPDKAKALADAVITQFVLPKV